MPMTYKEIKAWRDKEEERLKNINDKYEKGELILSIPKASEVVEGIYSKEQLQGLYTAQSMRSLGVGTIGSVIQYDIVSLMSGKEEAEKVRAGEKEKLAEGILGSTKQVGESNLEFTGRFWSSPEVAMDVYVPIATLGAGAALSIGGKALAGTRIGTGIIQGASKSSTLVTVGRALSSTAGQVAVVGGIVAVQEAPIVIETAIASPEMLGSTIGRTTYDVGMNLTGFIVGAEYGAKAYDVVNRAYQQNLFEKNYETMTSGRPLMEKTVQTSQAIDINKLAPKYQKAYDFETMAKMSANKYPVAKVPEIPVNVETRTYMITKPETGEVSFISYAPEGKTTVMGTINKTVDKETIMSGYRYYNISPELRGEVISELPKTTGQPGDMLGNIRTNLVSKLIREDTAIQENVFIASSKEMAELNVGKTTTTMNVGKTAIGKYVSPSEEKLILYGSKQEPIVFPEKLRSSSAGISATKEMDTGSNVERFKFKADKTKTISAVPEQFEKEYSATISEGLYTGEATKGARVIHLLSFKVLF